MRKRDSVICIYAVEIHVFKCLRNHGNRGVGMRRSSLLNLKIFATFVIAKDYYRNLGNNLDK